MRKGVRTWLLIGGFALLLLIGFVFFGSGRHLASLSAPSGFSLFSQSAVVLAGVDGNSFYEERCVDVSQYLNLSTKGYSFVFSGVDNHSCPLVTLSERVVTAKYLSYGYYVNRAGGLSGACGGGKYETYRCQSLESEERALGKEMYYSCVGNPSLTCGYYRNTKSSCTSINFDCYYPLVTVKGGFERVLNSCEFGQNDLLVAESFAGGQSITRSSLRYPMKSFCRAHPSIVTDDVTKTSITSTNIPQDLVDGKSVSISASQTLTVFYVIENNYRLPTLCDSGDSLALDVGANGSICRSTLGFTYLCSEGQFDALSGTCVVQPESKTVCALGRFDVGLGLCVYNPPLQVDCGSNDCFYSVDRDVCSCYVKSEFVCPDGFTLDVPTQSECVASGDSWELCPQCPVDKLCASDICVPSCDSGAVCVMESPTYIVCVDANASIRDGRCVVDGVTVVVCPVGQDYNRVTHNCELRPESITVCGDGSVPVKNSLSGVLECIASPPVFHDCPDGLMYDAGRDVCVDSVQAYYPLIDDFIVYKEVQKDCTADSDCSGIAGGLVCNVGTGFCQTPVYFKSSVNYWAIGLGVVVLGLLLLLLRKKTVVRRRK